MYLLELTSKLKKAINLKILYLLYDPQESEQIDWTEHQPLLLW